MNRNPSRKPTNVQAETPTAPTEAPVDAPAVSGPPPLTVGWKLAILVWVLGFFGLGAFEVFTVVWRLVKG